MRLSWAPVLGLLLVFVSGCFGSGDKGCSYWVDQLTKGKKLKESIVKIGELKCKDGVSALAKRFPDSLYRREILTSIKALGKSDDAIKIVQSALPDKEIGPLAIRMAMDWNISGIQKDLTKLVKSQRNASTRLQALEALVDISSVECKASCEKSVFELKKTDAYKKYSDTDGQAAHKKCAKKLTDDGQASTIATTCPTEAKKAATDAATKDCVDPCTGKAIAGLLDILIWVVGQEPTLQGVDTNAYAADQLAKVKWSEQDPKIAGRAAQNLIKALFLRDQKGNAAQLNARMALRAVGTPAAAPLIKAFQGTNTDINEFAEIRGLPKWKFTQGHELVEMLWDVGDPSASPALMKAIGIPLDPPPADVARLPEDQRAEWKNANSNRLATTALTVGALVNDDAIKYAVDLLQRRNPPPEASQFVNAGLGLALMGTPKSRTALWQLFEGGAAKIPEMRARIKKLKAKVPGMSNKATKKKAMKEHDDLIDEVAIIEDRRANFVTNLAVGLNHEMAAKFKAQVLDAEKGPLRESAKQPLPKAYYDVTAECGARLNCYLNILKSMQGKLDSVPKAIADVQKELATAQKAIKAEAKPINVKIKAKSKEIDVKYKGVLALKAEIEKARKTKKKVTDKIKIFNTGLDEMKVMQVARDKMYDERAAVYKKLAPIKAKFAEQQLKLYRLEKAALTLGSMPGGGKHLGTVAALFKEAQNPNFQQFRQWSLIAMEHLANKSNAAVIEDLVKAESEKGMSYWVLRLQSLLQRITR